jgi:hypothetical protein
MTARKLLALLALWLLAPLLMLYVASRQSVSTTWTALIGWQWRRRRCRRWGPMALPVRWEIKQPALCHVAYDL